MSEVRAGTGQAGEADEWATIAGDFERAGPDACTAHNGRQPRLPTGAQLDVPPELVGHPRYRILQPLGKGGMGAVFLAEHLVMKRAVALKVIAPHLLADPAAVARFRREVEAAASLCHPNIVTAHDAEQAGSCHFLVMELVDGIGLDEVVEGQGPLPVAQACDCARQAALGLQHAFERGMVHRDIKPHNLMLTRAGQVKVLDFGLTRFARDAGARPSLTHWASLTGTPDFMAPEQAEDAHAADIRADVYALGCTLYFLLTGQPPFPEGNAFEKVVAHQHQEPAPPDDFRPDLPAELVAIVGRMMAKEPAGRFQTPADVARVLRPFCKPGKRAGQERADETLALPERADAPPRRRKQMTSGKTAALRKRPVAARRRRIVPRWLLVVLALVIPGLLILGSLLALSGLRGRPDFRDDPDAGHVLLRSRDPNVAVAFRRDGKVVQTLRAEFRLEPLPAGDYDLEVVGGAPELRGFTSRVRLARGMRLEVDIRLEGILVHVAPSFGPPPRFPGGPE